MEVNPARQNINTLFSTTNYHIDFYQRVYKWNDDEVKRLIEDIFYCWAHKHITQYLSILDRHPFVDAERR